MKINIPIIKQYIKIKKKYKNKIIFFRLGDFYELFLKDAKKYSKSLGLQLTSKGKKKKFPMCGFPYKNVNIYISKIMNLKKEVVICNQVKDKNGKIKRKMTNIFSPGTFVNEDYLKNKINNYIVSVFYEKEYSLACLDLSVGSIYINKFMKINDLKNEIEKLNPAELLIPKNLKDIIFINKNIYLKKVKFNNYNNYIKIINKIIPSKLYRNNKKYLSKELIMALGCLLKYIHIYQKNYIKNINNISFYNKNDLLFIDSNTIKNLEIFNNNFNDNKDSLFENINLTQTAEGKRLLKTWLLNPLKSDSKILRERAKCVTYLKENKNLLSLILIKLKKIYDLNRLSYYIIKKNIKIKDLKKIELSLKSIKQIKKLIKNHRKNKFIKNIFNNIPNFTNIIKLIQNSINNDSEKNIIKENFDKKIDKYKESLNNFNVILNNYKNNEKKILKTENIKIIKIKDTLLIEINKKIKVPDNYKKIKELKNSVRYISSDLKLIEFKQIELKNKLLQREFKILTIICYIIKRNIKNIYKTIENIAILDVVINFANISIKNSWCEPKFMDYNIIEIKDGRHPILDLKNNLKFIPNDTILDQNNKVYIITGANMGGKSTYMRQVALITLLSHIGSHVPALEVKVGKIDKIFTRIGTNDDITKSMSTFMLEINELEKILRNSTNESLVLIDEIGRGTNHMEGKSIALAILTEFIIKKKSFLLFATHFYDISYISNLYNNVKSIYFKVIKKANKLIFLYKYIEGVFKKGFTLELSKMSGINTKIIKMASYYFQAFKKEELKKILLEKKIKKIKNLINKF